MRPHLSPDPSEGVVPPSPSPIVLISDGLRGGAGIAAVRAFRALQDLGEDVELWHFSARDQEGGSPPPAVLCLDQPNTPSTWQRLWKNLSRQSERRHRHKRHTHALLQRVHAVQPRLIHCHNLHGCGLNHDSLLGLPKSLPLVWTMHDCWPFQREAFRWQDLKNHRWESVPNKEVDPGKADERRERFFALRSDVRLTTPSRWLCQFAQQHLPGAIAVTHVPLALPLDQFHALPKTMTRATLGLDVARFWIGFGASSDHRRKGADILSAALRLTPLDGLGLLTWGSKLDGSRWPENLLHVHVGQVDSPERLNQLYSACNLFVCPSRADNFPLTVIESMACGTPVVGSDSGGVPEAIVPDTTGDIFPSQDPEALARILERRRRSGSLQGMAAQARLWVETHYAQPTEAKAYQGIYAELLRPSS